MAKKPRHRPSISAPLSDSAAASQIARVPGPQAEVLASEVLQSAAGPDVAHLLLQAQHMTRSHYSGPLPPADQFAQYEQARVGAADRILALAENEQSNRHELERRQIDLVDQQLQRDSAERRRAQWMSFAVILLGIGLLSLLAWNERATGPLGWVLTSVGGVGAFAAAATYVKGLRRKSESTSASKSLSSPTVQPE